MRLALSWKMVSVLVMGNERVGVAQLMDADCMDRKEYNSNIVERDEWYEECTVDS